jgi:hypothetical protein
MILNKYMEDSVTLNKVVDKLNIIKNKISFKNIFFVILSLLLANQTFITNIAPFTYVLFGVASLFDVPLILVLVSSIIANFIGNVSNLALAEILSFFVLFTLITSLLNIEGVSKKHSVYAKFILSFAIIELIFSLIGGELFTNLFANLGNILIISILYYIFSSGIYVIVNHSNTYIYSREESIAMIIVFLKFI